METVIRNRLAIGIGFLALIGVAFMCLRGSNTIMPLDDATIEAFQEAQSKATQQLHESEKDMSPVVESAIAVRKAIKAVGHNPDKTLLYWISPEFRAEVAAGNPAEVSMKLRMTANLLSVALGDSASQEEFDTILSHSSQDLRIAAQKRRSGE